jgi:hypothetical protein
MTAICAFETVKATSRIDVKQSCGSRPLTLQLVESARDPPLALNRAGLMADIRVPIARRQPEAVI